MLDQQYARYAAVLNELGDEVNPSDISDLDSDQITMPTTSSISRRESSCTPFLRRSPRPNTLVTFMR